MAVIEPNGVYNTREVCKLLAISPTTLWRMRCNGLPCTRTVGAPRFMGSDILAFMRSNRSPAAEVKDSKQKARTEARLQALREGK